MNLVSRIEKENILLAPPISLHHFIKSAEAKGGRQSPRRNQPEAAFGLFTSTATPHHRALLGP